MAQENDADKRNLEYSKDDEGPPIRRWTQAQTDAAGVAAGATVPDIKVPIPRDGFIVAVFGASFDPSLAAAETTNLWADLTSAVTMRINDSSPTNFRKIRMRSFSGTGNRPRRYAIGVYVNDLVQIDFTNERTVGNPMQMRLDIGLCDPDDIPGGREWFAANKR